ncbi:MAG: ATP synthase F1 subunit delta [Alphaproteobacteria bacterium]|nr:ATP synthase F1 subunit delta [Alphaproteobacteria bacterium]
MATNRSTVISSRYAGVLADLAEDQKSVSKIQKDVEALIQITKESDDFRTFISSPLMSKGQQAEGMKAIAKKAKLQTLTQNFLNVLIDNGRLNALESILRTFQDVMAKRSGEIKVQIQTAEKLTAAQEKNVAKKISKAIGSDVLVEAQVSPEILGGMIVTVGSYMVDDSVRRKLERLGSVLKQGANQNSVQNLKEVV